MTASSASTRTTNWGKLLADYKALLIKNGWKLTDEVRDFLTDNGVPGYGRLDSNS